MDVNGKINATTLMEAHELINLTACGARFMAKDSGSKKILERSERIS